MATPITRDDRRGELLRATPFAAHRLKDLHHARGHYRYRRTDELLGQSAASLQPGNYMPHTLKGYMNHQEIIGHTEQ